MTKLNHTKAGEIPGTDGRGIQSMAAKRWKTRLSLLAAISMVACASSAMAVTITPLGQGTLPSGEIISTVHVQLEPGDVFPWHFHPGPGWVTILSGTLTQELGCGLTEKFHAGSAFGEATGLVHMSSNTDTEPVVLLWTLIRPTCNEDWYFVEEPRCEGKSGKSHLEKIPDCP